MIVMKFGGSSLESSEAIRRVCSIIKTHLHQRPIVVVSAIGKTTNQLLSIAELASRGHGYKARKTLSALQDTHFRISDELVFGPNLHVLERSLQNAFREIHGIIHDLSEDGQVFTPELSDRLASFGERMSSEIIAATLLQSRVPTVHLDAREFILTDDRHGSATPLLWETYARLRRSIPQIAEDVVVVMGGFIASTEAGATTTLGRGGSDLTASLVGAGIEPRRYKFGPMWTVCSLAIRAFLSRYSACVPSHSMRRLPWRLPARRCFILRRSNPPSASAFPLSSATPVGRTRRERASPLMLTALPAA